jgi:hypothetical protein
MEPGAASLASAAIAEESMPPERKTPTGTSATSCIRTVSRRTSRSSPSVVARAELPPGSVQ